MRKTICYLHITDDKKVLWVLSSFKDFKHKQWIKLNRTELLKKTWDNFIDKFLTRWTEKHWDMNLSDKLCTFSQGSAHFYEWAQDFCAQASHLDGMPYAMDEKQVWVEISTLMDPHLCLHTKAATFTAIKEFNDWLDAVNNKYELYTADLAAMAEFLWTQQTQAPPPKKQKTNHAASGPSAAPVSGWVTFTLTNADANRVCCPVLTPEKRKLLENNNGCFKCRRFFVTHHPANCLKWPDASKYHTLTQTDVDCTHTDRASTVVPRRAR
ncbi:hypothetical protein H1R20_g11574, partial [Candolleomyces eurysporus]